MLGGCVLTVEKQVYDVGYVITVKVAARSDEYDYWYKLVDQENGITLGLYTNKNWDVGNTIHIGARWGKNYKE